MFFSSLLLVIEILGGKKEEMYTKKETWVEKKVLSFSICQSRKKWMH